MRKRVNSPTTTSCGVPKVGEPSLVSPPPLLFAFGLVSLIVPIRDSTGVNGTMGTEADDAVR